MSLGSAISVNSFYRQSSVERSFFQRPQSGSGENVVSLGMRAPLRRTVLCSVPESFDPVQGEKALPGYRIKFVFIHGSGLGYGTVSFAA